MGLWCHGRVVKTIFKQKFGLIYNGILILTIIMEPNEKSSHLPLHPALVYLLAMG